MIMKKKWKIKKYKYHKPERGYKPFPVINNEGFLIVQYNPRSRRYEILFSSLYNKDNGITINADRMSPRNLRRYI